MDPAAMRAAAAKKVRKLRETEKAASKAKAGPEGKKGSWGKPSKEKVVGALKSLTENPTPSGGEADADTTVTRSQLTSLRASNQTSTPGKAQDIIKRRRV